MLQDGQTIFSLTRFSKDDDLRIVKTADEMDLSLGIAPETNLMDGGQLPDFTRCVGSVVRALEPAFNGHDAPPPL